jgi:hypothetical protein
MKKKSPPSKAAMTLRLDRQLDDDLAATAVDLRMTKADFARRSIRRAVEHARKHEIPLITERIRRVMDPI